jgi:uncharacterized protein
MKVGLSAPPPAFHVMTKPGGPLCNLDCTYCFYLEKQQLFPPRHLFRMSDEVLERYIRDYIASQSTREVVFAWQGGEPTLLGIGFFEKAVALQERYGQGRIIQNAFQTNGTLLADAWGKFLRQHRFLVGISIDGPQPLHDHYRVDKIGRPTFDAVMQGLEVLKKHKVEFNTLTVVNRRNSQRPLEVYRFLKKAGSKFIQFIPLVERCLPPENGRPTGLAGPPEGTADMSDAEVTEWSVRSVDYGNFLSTIFREWVQRDVGRIFVQMFDATLAAWVGAPPGLCVMAPKCGTAVALEHNGDVYSCDHYVYPAHRLGSILETSFSAMLSSPQQIAFGNAKGDLPPCCVDCRYRFACHGGCPKHRFLPASDGTHRLNYLCAGYRAFFENAEPAMNTMRELLQAGKPADRVMRMRR